MEEEEEKIFDILSAENKMEKLLEFFNNGEISAKVVRHFYSEMNISEKNAMIDKLYSKTVRKENMKRIPPSILIPESANIYTEEEAQLYGNLLKYELLYEYNKSKVENKFQKLQKVINGYLGKSLTHLKCNNPMLGYGRRVFDEIAIKGFIEDLMEDSRGNKDVSILNLPSNSTIGSEIEFIGVDPIKLKKLVTKLESYGINYFKEFLIKYDGSLGNENNPGTEISSPVLRDKKEDWEKLLNVCSFIRIIGGKANKTCGGHIHFGSNILGVDKYAWKLFLTMWAEAEPLLYMISNRKGEKTRVSVERYSSMMANAIRRNISNLVEINNEEDIGKFVSGLQDSRYCSVNLTNIGSQNKNTIEFRLSNGSVDYDIWRENILLFGRMLQTAKLCSIDSTIKKDRLEKFFEAGLSEKEKLKRFLDLIFDKEEEKQIFYKRWESRAGENPIFGEYSVSTYKRQKNSERKNNKKRKEANREEDYIM